MKRLSQAAFAVLLMCFATACGESQKRVYPVQGQVFARKQPATNALVILTPLQDADPEKWPTGYPRGTVREDGSFQITTYRTDDGAPAGEYAVTAIWLERQKDKEEEVDRLQGRYANPKTSRFRVQIKEVAQGNTIEPLLLD